MMRLENISKVFDLNSKSKSMNSFFFSRVKFHALKNISIEIKKGEHMGIIGRNGSGKSTLLKILSGIYRSTKGKIIDRSRVIYLSGLSNGLQIKLTVRENIHLVGSIMDLSQNEIRKSFNAIIRFADLGGFEETYVYQLSEGMRKRLGYSIMFHSLFYHKPDYLLLDEVFRGGGDEIINSRVHDSISKLAKDGCTLIIASHDPELIKRYCNRCIVLDKGTLIFDGEPKLAIARYTDRYQMTL